MTVVDAVSGGVIVLGAIAAVVSYGRSSRLRRERERQRLAASWEALIRERDAARDHGVYLVQALNVYQRARRGSKAVIRWCDSGATQDAWFWDRHIPPGSYLLVRGAVGFGPHNSNPNVLYVQPQEVHRILPAEAPTVWQAQKQADL